MHDYDNCKNLRGVLKGVRITCGLPVYSHEKSGEDQTGEALF